MTGQVINVSTFSFLVGRTGTMLLQQLLLRPGAVSPRTTFVLGLLQPWTIPTHTAPLSPSLPDSFATGAPTAAHLHSSLGQSEVHPIHFLRGSSAGLNPVVQSSLLLNAAFIAFLPSLSHFPTWSLVLPGIGLQQLPAPSSCLRTTKKGSRSPQACCGHQNRTI